MNQESLIGIEDKESKDEQKQNPVQYYVKYSFIITYIFLLTTGTITFIEAMRTKTPAIRHVLNLETCISIVAGYFYSVFVTQIEKYSENHIRINWADITKTRYIDWSITTPMMLLTLCVVLGMNTKIPVKMSVLLTIIALNYAMLYTGYMGETGVIDRFTADIIGFIPFIAMFTLIFVNFVKPKYIYANYVLFCIYLFVWSMYGLVYMLNEELKNIAMNILDLIAKSMIGLGLWMYYTKIVQL